VVKLAGPGCISIVIAVRLTVASELGVALGVAVIEALESIFVQLKDPKVAAVSSAALVVLITGSESLSVVFLGGPDRVLGRVVVWTAHSVELLLVAFPIYIFVKLG
jgi:hypothetical protein